MNIDPIIQAIDQQIATLQQARILLANDVSSVFKLAGGKRRGRPLGSTNKTTILTTSTIKRAKRTLSPESRAKIAAAQKARWAAAKKPESA